MVHVPILKTLEVLLNDEGILAEVSKSVSYILYSGNISREKIFTKSSTGVLHENFARFYFRQCGKGRHATTSTV